MSNHARSKTRVSSLSRLKFARLSAVVLKFATSRINWFGELDDSSESTQAKRQSAFTELLVKDDDRPNPVFIVQRDGRFATFNYPHDVLVEYMQNFMNESPGFRAWLRPDSRIPVSSNDIPLFIWWDGPESGTLARFDDSSLNDIEGAMNY